MQESRVLSQNAIRYHLEYQKIMKSGDLSLFDKWNYGCLYSAMMNACKKEALSWYEKAGKIGTYFCDEKYDIALCYRKLERFNEVYQVYLDIADTHRKNGYELEVEQALGYAKETEDKIN